MAYPTSPMWPDNPHEKPDLLLVSELLSDVQFGRIFSQADLLAIFNRMDPQVLHGLKQAVSRAFWKRCQELTDAAEQRASEGR